MHKVNGDDPGIAIVIIVCAGGRAGEETWLWKERRTSTRSSCQGAGA